MTGSEFANPAKQWIVSLQTVRLGDLRNVFHPWGASLPHHPPKHPTLCPPCSRRLQPFPLPQGPGGAPLGAPMRGCTDEARSRFTSQHAHVVRKGVHAARRAGGCAWQNFESSRCLAILCAGHPPERLKPVSRKRCSCMYSTYTYPFVGPASARSSLIQAARATEPPRNFVAI